MFYTYILRSQSHPQALYTGSTSNLRNRLQDHNSGKSPHTSQFTPWTNLLCATRHFYLFYRCRFL